MDIDKKLEDWRIGNKIGRSVNKSTTVFEILPRLRGVIARNPSIDLRSFNNGFWEGVKEAKNTLVLS